LYIKLYFLPNGEHSSSRLQRPISHCTLRKQSVFTSRLTWNTQTYCVVKRSFLMLQNSAHVIFT